MAGGGRASAEGAARGSADEKEPGASEDVQTVRREGRGGSRCSLQKGVGTVKIAPGGWDPIVVLVGSAARRESQTRA